MRQVKSEKKKPAIFVPGLIIFKHHAILRPEDEERIEQKALKNIARGRISVGPQMDVFIFKDNGDIVYPPPAVRDSIMAEEIAALVVEIQERREAGSTIGGLLAAHFSKKFQPSVSCS